MPSQKFSTLSAKALNYLSLPERQTVSQSVGRPSFPCRSQICALSRNKRWSCLPFIVVAIQRDYTSTFVCVCFSCSPFSQNSLSVLRPTYLHTRKKISILFIALRLSSCFALCYCCHITPTNSNCFSKQQFIVLVLAALLLFQLVIDYFFVRFYTHINRYINIYILYRYVCMYASNWRYGNIALAFGRCCHISRHATKCCTFVFSVIFLIFFVDLPHASRYGGCVCIVP